MQGFGDKDILNRLTGNQNDETQPNFIKRKYPKQEREKKKQVARTKVQARKQPEQCRPQGEKGTTKNGTLDQWHETYQQPKELAGKT